MDNRPRGREKHITGTGKQIEKKGGGLIKIILIAALLLGGGGAGLTGLLGGFGSSAVQPAYPSYPQVTQAPVQPQQNISQPVPSSSFDLGSLLSSGSITNTSSGWDLPSNVGRLNTSVAPSARDKRTVILGNNSDTVTKAPPVRCISSPICTVRNTGLRSFPDIDIEQTPKALGCRHQTLADEYAGVTGDKEGRVIGAVLGSKLGLSVLHADHIINTTGNAAFD